MTNKYIILGKDYHWIEYDYGSTYTRHVDRIVDWFSLLKRGTLLDVGCGGGVILKKLSNLGFDVIGVDKEELAIQCIKEKCSDLNVVQDNIFNIRGSYDYILCSEVLEHIVDIDKFLDKIKLLLNGKILITTPLFYEGKVVSEQHIQEYTLSEFNTLVEKYFTFYNTFIIEDTIYSWLNN